MPLLDMGFFKFGKNRDVVDLGERYRKQQERMQASDEGKSSSEEEKSQENASPFGFFDMSNATSTNQGQTNDDEEGEVLDLSDTLNTRRRKLTKRILDMTSKMEDLGNQVYHLQQRIEVLEKKLDVNRFD